MAIFAAIFGLVGLSFMMLGDLGIEFSSSDNDDSSQDDDVKPEILSGSALVNLVFGGDGSDEISGETGDDILSGENGDDTLKGEDGRDLIHGGTGNDDVQGGAGNDTVSGGDGSDMLRGDEGEDALLGNGGDDALYGGASDDNIAGGAGRDKLFGEEGNDRLVGGFDIFNLEGKPVDPSPEAVKALGDIAENDPDLLENGSEAEILTSDYFYGIDLNFLGGTTDPDGTDSLYGGEGDDTLVISDDFAEGGDGDDVFILHKNANTGVAVISDFGVGNDVIEVEYQPTESAPKLNIEEDGPDALVRANGDIIVRVAGKAGTLTASDVRTVEASYF